MAISTVLTYTDRYGAIDLGMDIVIACDNIACGFEISPYRDVLRYWADAATHLLLFSIVIDELVP